MLSWSIAFISLRIKYKFVIVQKRKFQSSGKQIISVKQKKDAGDGTWTHTVLTTTGTWSLRVCQFRHSCMILGHYCNQESIIQIHITSVNCFFILIESFFSKYCRSYKYFLFRYMSAQSVLYFFLSFFLRLKDLWCIGFLFLLPDVHRFPSYGLPAIFSLK